MKLLQKQRRKQNIFKSKIQRGSGKPSHTQFIQVTAFFLARMCVDIYHIYAPVRGGNFEILYTFGV